MHIIRIKSNLHGKTYQGCIDTILLGKRQKTLGVKKCRGQSKLVL